MLTELLDLDFMEMYPNGILLQPELYTSLMDTIERDCRALESLKIMDYSFLMGIHNLDQPGTRRPLLAQMQHRYFGEREAGGGSEGEGERAKRPAMLERVGSFQQRQRLIAHSTALESITAEVDEMAVGDMDEQDTVDMCSAWGGIPAKNQKGENLLLFIGIIDILQSFGVTKKLEHTWKSIIHDGDTVSVHRPSFYATRFKKFLAEKVFRKLPPNLKPALSFRKCQTPNYKRTQSRDVADSSGGRPGREGEPSRQTSEPGGAVTVITIGSEGGQEAGAAILPSVLRDKPRLASTGGAGPGGGPGSRVGPRVPAMGSHLPDVADVIAGAACTPPPDSDSSGFASSVTGGVTSGDERVQIYVPSPQSTPYSTISKV